MNGTEIIRKRVERDERLLRDTINKLAVEYLEALERMHEWDADLLTETEMAILRRLRDSPR